MITQIQNQPLTPEQRSYLDGIFAGLRNRGVTFEDVAPNPTARAQPEPENLTAEERIKRELHPLDTYPQLLELAQKNAAPDKENLFRFKWNGLFYLSPNKEAFMARLRIPGGQLKSFQLREIAGVARELTTGFIQITTRANLQIRLIEPKNAPAVLSRIQSVGLHTRGAGADNIRNITANPTAGIDSRELIDTLPLCHQLAQIIINDRSFYNLPRKFNIAFDGGGLIGTLEDTNDLGIRAVRVPSDPIQEPTMRRVVARGCPSMPIRADVFPLALEGEGQGERGLVEPEGNIPPGVYFRISAGGASGHKAFANDLGVLVPPDRILAVITALVRVYIAHGDRSNRKRARLKHLLETWSLQKYREEAEKLLGYKMITAPPSAKNQDEPPSSGQIAPSHSHLGVYPQKQKGLNYIGVAVPVGVITPRQLLRLADLADNYGSGEVRLTVWQNLILPNIPDAFVETVKRAIVQMGLDWKQSNLRGLVACTGNSYCKFASANTKKHALELGAHLEKEFELDQPLNIHLTGCPNSCAQHYIGDIGLLATPVKVSGETLEGYHVFVGGGFGEHRAVGRQVFQGLSTEDLKKTIARMLRAYQLHRYPGERFQDFTARHDLNQLQVLFSEQP